MTVMTCVDLDSVSLIGGTECYCVPKCVAEYWAIICRCFCGSA